MTTRGGLSPRPAEVGRGRGRARGKPKSPLPKPPGVASSVPAPAPAQVYVLPVQSATLSTATGECLSVTAHISSLADGVSTDDLEFYFETVCDDETVEISTPLILGGGKAELVLKGLTREGLQQLESRGHKIKRKQVTVEFEPLSEDKPQLKSDEEDGEEEEPTKIKVGNAPDVDTDTLKAFFEGPKSGGCADAVAEIEKISLGVFHVTFHYPKVAAQVVSKPRAFKKKPLQLSFVQEAPSEPHKSDSEEKEPRQIEVSNVPDVADEELVKVYFEGAKSGGCANAVAECTQIQSGVFLVTFYDPKVAAQVMSKSHKLVKAPLQLQFARQEKKKVEEFKRNQLAVHGLPEGVKKTFYEVVIAGCLEMEEEDDFELEVFDSSAIITFTKDYSTEELQEMMGSITSVAVKGVTVTVEMVKATKPSIRVSNLITQCDEEFLRFYFGNAKRSGGGEVESVKILSETEAIVTFADPAVFQSVLGRQHHLLGNAIVEECGSGTSSFSGKSAKVSPPAQPLQIPVDPLLTQSLTKSLEQSVLRSQVTISADEEKGMLVFSPTSQSKPSWQQDCQDQVSQCMANSLTTEDIHVPKEVAAQAVSIALKLQKQNPGLKVVPSSDGTIITVAGQTTSVNLAKEAIDNLCSTITDSASVLLSPEDFDFFQQVKKSDLPSSIACTFEPSTFTVFLRGPIGAVTKLKDSIGEFVQHADSPVMLDPLVAEFFKTEAGRGKLETFLQQRQCHVAVHFTGNPILTLHLLSNNKDAHKVKAVVQQISLYVTTQAIPIPDTVVPIISDLEDFGRLRHTVENEHGVLIKHVGLEISAAGFKAEVSSSLAEISKFLKEKASPLPPSEMKVSMLVARSLQQSPQGVRKSLPFHVPLHIDKGSGILQFTPKHYIKPGWEEDCKSSVSEYIQSHIAEVKTKVPEKAYSDVMAVLYESQQDDNTFVFSYPPNSTSLAFAGETNTVQSTQDRIAQISENYCSSSEEVVLKPEAFEFLSQLKMEELINKFRSVEIEPFPDTYTLILSGTTKGLKAVKEHLPTVTAHATVAVELDQPIVEFLASEKGKDRLFSLLREKRCDKCATYISESPMKLLLLCAPKHKNAVEKVPKLLQGSTSMVPLQIPDLLVPFLPDLPEFLKKVTMLEKQNPAKITVQGKQIVVAGFQDGVTQATDALSAFVKEKMIHFQPIQIPVDPMIAKCVHNNLTGLQACMSSIYVNCTLKTDKSTASVSISPTKASESGWKEGCKSLLTSYIDENYLREKIEIPKSAANSVFQILVKTQNQSNFHFDMHDDGSHAIVAGERNAVQAAQAQITHICSQQQTSETIDLSIQEYDFFTQIVQHRIESKVIFECTEVKHSVTIGGSIREVTDLKNSMKEMVQHSVVPVVVDEIVVDFVNAKGKPDFEKYIKKNNLKAAIHVNTSVHPHTLELLCDNQLTQSVTKVAEKFPEEIDVATVKLPTTVTTPPVSQEFREHCQKCSLQSRVFLQTKEETLQICGFRDPVDDVKKSIETFIKKKCTVKQSCPLQKGIWRLLCGPMKQRWKKIEGQCQDSDVSLTQPSEDERKLTIALKGDRVEVQKLIHEIHELVKSVEIAVVPLKRPQVRNFFSEGEDGNEKIPHIEKSTKVCIEVCEVGEDMDIEMPEVGSTTTRGAPKLVKECTADVVNMKRISIYIGDITEFRADVIVNAANEDLKHIGGVADAILKKGGQQIQVVSDRYVRSHGKLNPGEAWLSDEVGYLPCMALIHAVGPRWYNNPSGMQQLKKVCVTCLKQAKAYSSIALPAISSGVFGCPIRQCADILVSAAIDFCKSRQRANLNEINFVLFKPADVSEFIRALQDHLPPQNIQQRSDGSTSESSYGASSYGASSYGASSHGASSYGASYSGSTYSSRSKPSQSPQQTYPLLHEAEDSEEDSEEEFEEEAVIVQSPSSLSRVLVQQGSILDVEAEIYVNSTNGKMDLSGGAVAQALAKAAGPALQAECTKKAPIAAGEIAVTGPGKILRCKCIIHINCPGFDHSGGQAEDMLRTIMNRCMKECDRRGASTIVFPAIGTGNLGFPITTAAHIMVDEVCNYLQRNKCKSLSMVYFIIFMENMYRTFFDELETRKQQSGSAHQPPPRKVTKIKKSKKDKRKVRGSREEPFDRTPQTKYRGQRGPEQSQISTAAVIKRGDHTFDLGNNITVHVSKGNITSEKTDVIVNTTNKRMMLDGSAVAKALLSKAGKDLQKACNEVTQNGHYLSEGEVIDTRPGKLKCKRVFHIVFHRQTFVAVIIACIKKVIDLQYTSIAFPAIGTGVEGVPPADAATEMIKGLQKCNSPYAITVRIVLFSDAVCSAFKATINDHLSSWYERAGRSFKNMIWGQQQPEGEEEDEAMEVDAEDNGTETELRVYGETEENVKAAMDTLNRLINKQFISEDYDDKRISSLERSQVKMLRDEARQLQLTFGIDRILNIIELKGSKDSIAEMKTKIEKVLGQVEKEAARKEEAERFMKIVQWKRSDSNDTPYDSLTNLEIEEAYKNEKAKYTFGSLTSGEHFTIDFKKMEEIDHAMKNKKWRVKRITEGAEGDVGGLPDDWEPMTDPKSGKEVPLRVIDLAATSEGYKFVLAELGKTMSPTAIIKIQRIQNSALYGQYTAQKKSLDAHNPKGTQNECWLFHGTKESSIPLINQTNFNRSYRGQNGTVYGQGCYFARDASYSDRYAQPDPQGVKRMYVARVLTGQYTTGSNAMIVPPPKDPKDPAVLFDSAVDNMSNPGIYVVFYDANAYPEYLVTYQ